MDGVCTLLTARAPPCSGVMSEHVERARLTQGAHPHSSSFA